MKYDDLIESGAQHVCIFGEPYTGKSTLASSLAELGFNLIWFSFDKGYTVIRKLSPEARARIEIIRVPDTKDSPMAANTALKAISGAAIDICDLHGRVGCSLCKKDGGSFTHVHLSQTMLDTVVVFDHATQIADSIMNVVILDSIKNGQRDATGTKETDPDKFKPGHDQFRLSGFLMTKFLGEVQAANYHIICIAHVAESEMEDGRKKLVPLVGSVPFSRNSAKYFDHVICCEVFNRKHSFGSSTTYGTSIVSGSRTDIDISKEATPSLKAFFGSPQAVVAKKVVDPILSKMKEQVVNELKVAQSVAVADSISESELSSLVGDEDSSGKSEVSVVIGAVTSATPAAVAVESNALSVSEKAKAALARMRQLKGL